MMKKIRIGSWVLIAVLVVFLSYSIPGGQGWKQPPQGSIGEARIGGAFSIASTDGGRLTEKDLLGKPWMLFFGFTY